MLRSEDLENLKTSLLSRHRLPVFNKLTGSRVSNLIPDFLEEISKIKNTAYNNNENFSFVLNEKNENNLPETFFDTEPQKYSLYSGQNINPTQTFKCNFNRFGPSVNFNLNYINSNNTKNIPFVHENNFCKN
jgi:hypothetical protein